MNYKLRNAIQPRDIETCLEDILTLRGVEDIESFLNPSSMCELNPFNLDNVEEGAEMLLNHLNRKSRICFVVDCDADGYTSSAILWNYIKAIFPNADLSFTVHDHKQHGLSDKIEWFTDVEQFDLVVCPDSASYDVEHHLRLKEVNTDVLCLDHHEQMFDEDGNPIISTASNTVVINNQLSPRYANKTLCGAGVVYKFCQVLDTKLGIAQAGNFVDLVSLGLIADVMKRTTSETNYLMMKGLQNIKNGGLVALIEAQSFSLKDKASYPYLGLTPIDIAFYIAPLINAITRVGTIKEKETMFYAFIEPNRVVQSTKRGAKEGDTETAAGQTARVGTNAKNRQNKIKEKALDLIDFKIQKDDLLQNNIIVVEIDDEDNIPQELSGLVAMAVVTKYHKPCLIARRNSKDVLQGSMRSDSNFAELPNFKEFLENSNYFNFVAGHNAAAGYSIDAAKLNSFLNYSNTTLSEESFKNCYLVDYIFKSSDSDLIPIGLKIAGCPEYFGNGIDEVKVVIEDISLANIMVMGADKSSIKISEGGIDFVKFKDTDFIDEVQNNRQKKLIVYGRLNLNEWAGRKSLQVFIDDYELKDDSSKYDF